MRTFPNSTSITISLEKGDDLHATLQNVARQYGWKSAWVQGLGGSALVTLGFYNPNTKEYQWKTFTGQHEILGLEGNLAWVDNEPLWHIHGTFSGADYAVKGGHVKDLLVGLTCELLVTPLEASLTRVFDDDTGLKLLRSRMDGSLA